MTASNKIKKYVDSKKLPPGHIATREASEELQKEYELCNAIESKWNKHLRLYISDEVQALEICNKICDMLGETRVKDILFFSPCVQKGAQAHYSSVKKHIHVKYSSITWTVLIHELVHHFGVRNHGEKFCELLSFILPIAYTLLTDKQPKSDW